MVYVPQQNNILLWSDTDSVMLEFGNIGEQSTEEYVEIADEIGSITNESFPDAIMHMFNAPEERKHSIKTDREIVADKSLFLSKKRYIMHVINDEGKKVDKMKIMGVEIKKSSTPDIVKKMLMDLVNMILDGVPDPDIVRRVKDMKFDYMNCNIRDISLPISCKGLKKYQDKIDETGSMKGVPYQVRASMFYNSLCGDSDKKIVPGDKVSLMYIKHPKSKYIAYPIDINDFPKFMDDIIVDWETQWDKAFIKLENYMSSVGLDIKSRKKSVRKDLFGF